MLSQRYDSQEYVPVIVEPKQPGTFYDPTADPIQYQFVDPGKNPSGGGWSFGLWETDNSTADPIYYALCMAGPSGPYVPKQNHTAWLFVKITDNPEIPVLGPMTIKFT